jgi:peptide/nickel transport system ATP-binding protein/oligopeptide transport system ATP-binding protein
VIDRCRIEVPQLLTDGAGHATACHRTAELPPPETVTAMDSGFSPALEKLVAAFSKGTEGAGRNGVDMVGTTTTVS